MAEKQASDDKETTDNKSRIVDGDRRETIKKIGKFAYAAPVMVSLLASSKVSAASEA